MACNITITSVNVYGSPGQPVSSVEVKGTATECNQNNVVVGINCGGTEKTISVMANPLVTPPEWKAIFSDLTGTGCICGSGFMRVTAKCKADQNCPPAIPWTLTPPQCQPPEPKCPELGEITTSPAKDCFAPGDVVKLAVYSNDPDGCIVLYYWNFSKLPGQCTGGPNPQCPGGGSQTSFYDMPPTSTPNLAITFSSANGFTEGNWTVQVSAFPPFSSGCDDCPPVASQLLPFSIMQPNTCPQATIDEPVLMGTSSAGFEYKFTAHFTGNTSEARVRWNFGSGLTDPVCLCGGQTNEATHTYPKSECEKTKTVSILLEAGNACCPDIEPAKEFQLPPCNGGNGNGHHPCPPWWPFCKGWNLCAAILASALLAILAAGVLFMVWACLYPAIYNLLYVALAAAATGLILLGIWYAFCRYLPGFCDSLKDMLDLLAYIIYIQTIILAILTVLAALGWLGVTWLCVGGAAITWGYYGMVVFWLLVLNSQADCPPYNPPTFGSQALTSKGINEVRHD